MLTDRQILDLIALPKTIVRKEPARAYREDNLHKPCDLELKTVPEGLQTFTVFVRQNTVFIENFSIGLRYQTRDGVLGTITLTRYNGPHGETSRSPDGHYALPHIHRITEEEIVSGHMQPQEKHREITTLYRTLEEGLRIFFANTGITNFVDYFPELQQGRLFDG